MTEETASNANQLQQVRQPPDPSVISAYNGRLSVIFGSLLIVGGGLSLILTIIIYSLAPVYSGIGQGFWCGPMCIIAGSFGISAGQKKTQCLISAFLGLSISAASMCLTQLAFAILGAVVDATMRMRHDLALIYSLIALNSIIAILAVVAGISGVWGSTLACKVLCACCRTTSPLSQNNEVKPQ